MVRRSSRSLPADHELVLLAESALESQQWSELRGLGQRLCDEYPENSKGPRFAAIAAREEGDLEVAEKLLTAAIELFPDVDELAVEHAWVAVKREDWPAAEERWARVRAREPHNVSAYLWAAFALRREQRYEAAEGLIGQAMVLFPEEAQPSLDYASIALERGDFEAARGRYDHVRQSYPNEPMGPVGLGIALTRLNRLEEADKILAAAKLAYPEQVDAAIHYALVAQERRDWAEALRRFSQARRNFAKEPQLALGVATALAHLGEFDVAERELEAARHGFSDDVAGVLSLSELARHLSEQPNERHLQRELLARFESLGDNCEFGLVQRRFGAEPLGLLRWSGTCPADVARALRSRLEGVGDPNNTSLELYNGQEYFIKDTRGWFEMHTFIRAGQAPYELLYEQQLRRLQFLSRKLIEDLLEARKIFLYKPRDGRITEQEIEEIHAATRGYGAVTLLVVQLGGTAHPDGSVVPLSDGLLLGYLARVSTNAVQEEITYDSWYRLCLNAAVAVCARG
jgi:tetratricopeptide (TPR) repeat protein